MALQIYLVCKANDMLDWSLWSGLTSIYNCDVHSKVRRTLQPGTMRSGMRLVFRTVNWDEDTILSTE